MGVRSAAVTVIGVPFVPDSLAGVARHEPDPVVRLRAVRRQTAQRKEGHDAAEMDDLVRRLGCTHGQGFLYAPPLPGYRFKPLLDDRAAGRPSYDPQGVPVPGR